jgi:serine/threonine-protein kinase RsbW
VEFTKKPLAPFGKVILDIAIPTDLSLKMALVYRMANELMSSGCLPSQGSSTAELAFDEALTNAMVHGNGLDSAKTVRVKLFADDERWGAIIEDEGKGFTREQVPQLLGVESLLREAGRGIMIMDSYVDELKYNAAGNKLMLVRRREGAPAAGAPAAPRIGLTVSTGSAVSLTAEGDVAVVEVLHDNLSTDNAEEVRAELNRAAQGFRAILLDVHRVGYVSSAGIGLLVATYRSVAARKGFLVLAGVNEAVRDVFEKTKIAGIFQFAADRAEGMVLIRDYFS